MTNTTVIKNAHVILENGIIYNGFIVTENGKIKSFGRPEETEIHAGAEIIDAGGAYVGPGFVDIHVHGGGGYSTCFEPVKAANHFLCHGETSILATPSYNDNADTLTESMHSIKEGMKKTRVVKGIYSEGPYTNPDYGANSFKNPWRHGILEKEYKRFVDAGGEYVKVWTIAPELSGLVPFLEYAKKVNPNTVFALGHSEATPMQIRSLPAKYKPMIMTHATNATGRVERPRGTRGVGPDEYCFKERDMYAEMISDSCGMHVHPEMQQLLLHTKGIDKIILVSDSTVNNDPKPPQYAHIKDLNFDMTGDLAGSNLTLDMACRNVCQSTGCGIAEAFLMASSNPAKAIGMYDEIGSIATGKNADLVFVDDKFNVQKVMLEGKIVSEKGELI